MRILHIATTLAGGAGIGLWRYHGALRSAGVDSRILVLEPPAGAGAEVGRIHWRPPPLPFRLARRLGLVRPIQERLRARIAALDRQASSANYELFTLPHSDYRPEEHPWVKEADILSLHWTAGVLDWPRFFRRVRQPVAFTLHDQQPYLGGFHYALDAASNPHLAAIDAEFRQLKRNCLRGHRLLVVANSRWNEAQARASGFFPAETPMETVYYPLDATLYRPGDAEAAKRDLGLPAGRPVIGFACENLNNRRKGFLDLLEALQHLPLALRQGVALLSFGRDPSPELRARVELPWRHLGYLDQDQAKIAAYAAMDVFVVPSRAEAFGLAAIEAEAVGVPVVTYPLGGLAEAVPYAARDYPDAGSPSSTLGQGIIGLLTDVARRADRAAAGRREVARRHDPARIGGQLAAFFTRHGR